MRGSTGRKLLFLLLIQVLILVLWMISVVFIQNRNDTAAAIRKNEACVLNIYNTLSAEVNELRNASAFPIVRNTNGIPNAIYRAFSQENGGKNLSHEANMELDELANGVLTNHPIVSRICVVNTGGTGFVYDRNSLWRNSSIVQVDMTQPWVIRAIEEMGRASGPMLLDSDQLGCKNSEQYLYAVRAIVNAEQYRVIGLCVIGMDRSVVENLFLEKTLFAGQSIMLTSQGGILITSGEESIFPEERAEEVVSRTVRQGREQYSLTWIDPAEADIGIVSLTKISAMHQQAGEYIIPVYITIALLIVATLLCSLRIISDIQQPILQLQKAVEAYANGHFDYRAEGADTNSDFASLQNSVNEMALRIQSLIDEVYVQNLEKKEYQLRLLRRQINPHFLYNALESARMRAYFASDLALESMLLSLSNVLHYGLTLSDQPATIRQELDNIDAYMNVCNACAKRKIELEVQVDESCLEVSIPRMTLQPLVENSIKHGFGRGDQAGTIRIMGWLEEDRCILRIVDNGRGSSPERIAELNSMLLENDIKKDRNSGSSIGLLNVHHRIRLTQGEAYGLQVSSVEGIGFSAEIRLPISGKEWTEDESDSDC